VLPLNVKEQLQKIQKSTEETQNQVGRIVTKFNSIFVQAVYELPQTEPDVKVLRDSLVEISQKVREAKRPLPGGLGLSYSDSGGRTPDPIVSVDLDQLLQADFLGLASKLVNLVPLITFLKQPTLQLAINRSPRDKSLLVDSFLGHSDPPDLRLYVHTWPVDPPNGRFGKVILDPRDNRLLVSWNGFDYPSDKWSTSLKVTSFQDLNHAQLVVMLSGTGNIDERIDKIAAGSVPIWLNINFDHSFVTFVDLERLPPVLTWQAFTATFPDTSTILGGKVSHPLDPAYGWGY
jgi:hypothetical protein